jgi:1-deoxyxylulose-5-phosphate synthase
MDPIDRRRFLGATAGAAAVLGSSDVLRAAESLGSSTDPAELPGAGLTPPAPPIVELGDTGIRLSRLAQGTGVRGGRRQSDQTRMGFAQLVSLFQHAYDRGVTCFDLADLYGTHVYFREALRTISREQVTILTKMWWQYDGPQDQTHRPERRQMAQSTLERFRHELNTDTIDIMLLHCLMRSDWPRQMQPYMDVLSEEKEAGRIRAVGCSCHDLGALKTAAVTPWVDVILARINLAGASMDGPPEEVIPVLQTAKENGKALIGMKIFGEGRLADQRDECMKFAQELGLLDAMTIGFHTPEQIDEVLWLMAKHPAKTA